MDIGEHNLTEQRSKLFTATSHQYFNKSGVDHMTSGSCTGAGAVAVSNRSLLLHLEERRTSEWELGKATSFKACDRATIIAEDNGIFDIVKITQ